MHAQTLMWSNERIGFWKRQSNLSCLMQPGSVKIQKSVICLLWFQQEDRIDRFSWVINILFYFSWFCSTSAMAHRHRPLSYWIHTCIRTVADCCCVLYSCICSMTRHITTYSRHYMHRQLSTTGHRPGSGSDGAVSDRNLIIHLLALSNNQILRWRLSI